MKTEDIEEAKQYWKKQHKKEHYQKLTYNYYIYCYSLPKRIPKEYIKFWDWIQVQFDVILSTGYLVQIFEKIIRNRKKNKSKEIIKEQIKNLLVTIIFEEFVSIERKIEILEKTIEIFETKNNFEDIKSLPKSPTSLPFGSFEVRIFEELRNLRFETPENITKENNYLEDNSSITTKNTEKSEILIMDAETQA